MTYIDKTSQRHVDVKRRSQSQDSEGDYGLNVVVDIYKDIVADIQPYQDKLKQNASGYNETATHVMFTRQNLNDIRVHDVVIDKNDNNKEYEVISSADFRDHCEFLLKEL